MDEKDKTNTTKPEQPKTTKALAFTILSLIGNLVKVIDMMIGNGKENDEL